MGRTITIDLHYLGQAGIISVFAAPTGDGGFVLLDSGPASTLPALEQGVEAAGLALGNLRAVLLTHVHLDHAAAAGTLSRQTGCEVWAHPDGLAHLRDPGERLLPSALRLYGSRLEVLFGTMEAVPAERLHAVEHGAAIRVGSLELTGWHTPPHRGIGTALVRPGRRGRGTGDESHLVDDGQALQGCDPAPCQRRCDRPERQVTVRPSNSVQTE